MRPGEQEELAELQLLLASSASHSCSSAPIDDDDELSLEMFMPRMSSSIGGVTDRTSAAPVTMAPVTRERNDRISDHRS